MMGMGTMEVSMATVKFGKVSGVQIDKANPEVIARYCAKYGIALTGKLSDDIALLSAKIKTSTPKSKIGECDLCGGDSDITLPECPFCGDSESADMVEEPEDGTDRSCLGSRPSFDERRSRGSPSTDQEGT
jgi:hypothetical protein